MTERVLDAVNRILDTEDGQIFMAYLVSSSDYFGDVTESTISLRNFITRLLIDTGMYNTSDTFPKDYIKACMGLPKPHKESNI